MANREPTDVDRKSSASRYADLVYRCVCGESLRVDPECGAECPACHRCYQPEIFDRGEGGETILATLCQRRDDRPIVADDDEQDESLVGQQWEHFRIVERLGRGGMGAVYRALDESLQRYVALKVIRGGSDTAQDSPRVRQLIQEARAQARVNHPHVVHIYFVGRAHDVPFFAMELIGGPTLEQRLRQGPLPFAEVVRVARQVASALQQSARFDIVHGDIKPSNILQAGDDAVKLSDFGLARRLSELDQTDAGTLAGTPNYLSPETAAGKPIDFRSDMYSLGVTLFELTFGKLPYSYSTPGVAERLHAHQSRPVEFPEPWPDSVPEAWKSVLERLLAKRPEDRYADYAELLADLERVRPLSLPPAGRIQRGLAWLVDLMLILGAQALLAMPFAIEMVREFLTEHPVMRLLTAFSTVFVPFLATSFVCWWGNTPGKKLFQLRVVDAHGLQPSRTRMAPRSVMQYALAWDVAISHVLNAVGLDALTPAVNLAVGILLLVEMGFVLFTRRRQALHDKLLRTQVVLDARPTTGT